MKKSLFTSLFAPVLGGFVLTLAVIAGSTPVVANAQPYYGTYINSSYGSCINLTVYQGPGSTDAETGGQVTILQEFLNQTGYLSGVSGTFDNGTLGAVINYQRAYDLAITGTVTPQTMAAINAQSCDSGVANGYGYSNSYPVTNYSSGQNCYWTGGVDSTYVCSTVGSVVSPAVPIYPSSVNCSNYLNTNYFNSNYGSCAYNRVLLNSLSASYTYNAATITISGYGFSTSGNTVYFGNSIISNVFSPNGTTITFTAPVGYYTGTYDITVTNASGISSNALSYIMNSNSGYNGYNPIYPGQPSGYNNYQSTPILSNISGPSQVNVGQTDTWTVTESNNSYNGYYNNSYGNNGVTLTATWGDNYNYNNTSNTQQAYANASSQTYSFSHVYETPGTYTLRITATNSSGQSTSETYLITVTGSNYYYQPQVYSYQPIIINAHTKRKGFWGW